MDKYKLALLGEAGAAGLDRGFSIRYKVFYVVLSERGISLEVFSKI
jgi:hypothetical protein